MRHYGFVYSFVFDIMLVMKKQNNNKSKREKNNKHTVKNIGIDDNQKYFVAINQDLKTIQEVLRTEMATKTEFEKLHREIATKMVVMEEKIIRHFDVAVEQIDASLRGANADHLSLLDDTKKDHEARIAKVEVRVGLR